MLADTIHEIRKGNEILNGSNDFKHNHRFNTAIDENVNGNIEITITYSRIFKHKFRKLELEENKNIKLKKKKNTPGTSAEHVYSIINSKKGDELEITYKSKQTCEVTVSKIVHVPSGIMIQTTIYFENIYKNEKNISEKEVYL